MVTKEELSGYIAKIPAIPATLKECSAALSNGDMVKAAHIASSDKALMAYFQNIVNKPIFGFRNELTDATQIFGALGIDRVKQLLRSYYTLLITPSKWEMFKLSTKTFQDFQADLIVHWEKILNSLEEPDKELHAIVTLVPAAIAVCEDIFKEHKEMIETIKSQKAISYEALLKKTSGYNFFNIITVIANKWDFSQKTIELLKSLSDVSKINNPKEKKILSYLSLLINYKLSQPIFIESGLNDLFEINTNFEEDLIVDFYELIKSDNP